MLQGISVSQGSKVSKKDYPVPQSCISLVYSQSFNYSDGKCGTEKVALNLRLKPCMLIFRQNIACCCVLRINITRAAVSWSPCNWLLKIWIISCMKALHFPKQPIYTTLSAKVTKGHKKRAQKRPHKKVTQEKKQVKKIISCMKDFHFPT